jgi:hypothetical protein
VTITNKVSLKSVNGGNTPIADVPDGATVSTITDAFDGTATVAATAAATGGTPTTYTITPTPTTSPATFTGTSPVTVSGLSDGTSYTFTAKGVNSTATGPAGSSSSSFTPVVAGSYYSIATTTLGTTASSITFSSIPSTYSHLQIRMLAQTNRATYGGDNFYFRVGLSSVDSGSNYSWHNLYGNGSSTDSNNGTTASYINVLNGGCLGTTAGSSFGSVVIDILDYTNTNKYKTTRALGGTDDNGASSGGFGFGIGINSGSWRSTSAIDTITLYPMNGSSFTQYSKFALYGVIA